MGLTIKQSRPDGEGEKAIITLAGEAAIGEVGKVKEAVLAALTDCETLLLDVGEITGADPALFQLIHAAGRTAGHNGKEFVLVGESSALYRGAAISAGFLAKDDSDDTSAQVLGKE